MEISTLDFDRKRPEFHEFSRSEISSQHSTNSFDSSIGTIEYADLANVDDLNRNIVDSERSLVFISFKEFIRNQNQTHVINKKNLLEQRKRKKIAKCDLLDAFFRVYFRNETTGMVCKNAIYNLYCKKIERLEIRSTI